MHRSRCNVVQVEVWYITGLHENHMPGNKIKRKCFGEKSKDSFINNDKLDDLEVEKNLSTYKQSISDHRMSVQIEREINIEMHPKTVLIRNPSERFES